MKNRLILVMLVGLIALLTSTSCTRKTYSADSNSAYQEGRMAGLREGVRQGYSMGYDDGNYGNEYRTGSLWNAFYVAGTFNNYKSRHLQSTYGSSSYRDVARNSGWNNEYVNTEYSKPKALRTSSGINHTNNTVTTKSGNTVNKNSVTMANKPPNKSATHGFGDKNTTKNISPKSAASRSSGFNNTESSKLSTNKNRAAAKGYNSKPSATKSYRNNDNGKSKSSSSGFNSSKSKSSSSARSSNSRSKKSSSSSKRR